MSLTDRQPLSEGVINRINMGCRPRNAVWSGMQPLRKTQQKTRLSFNAVMLPTCAAALVGLPTDPKFGCLDGAAVAMDQLPARTTPSPTMERRKGLIQKPVGLGEGR